MTTINAKYCAWAAVIELLCRVHYNLQYDYNDESFFAFLFASLRLENKIKPRENETGDSHCHDDDSRREEEEYKRAFCLTSSSALAPFSYCLPITDKG